MDKMSAGVTKSAEALNGKAWNVLGQTYTLKQLSETSMAWAAEFPPGTFVPPHSHVGQDEFILMHEGELTVLVDGQERKAGSGDLLRLPKGEVHGIFNKSNSTVRCMFWVAPAQSLYDLFERIHGLTDPAEVVRISIEHDVLFLPPPQN